MNLSRNLTLEEFTHSDTAIKLGIDNTMPNALMPNAVHLACFTFEAIRTLLGVPLKVSSGYRSEELNKAVKGQVNSQHKLGMAIDFVPVGMNLDEAFDKIVASNIPFDQLIRESTPSGVTWIHVSKTPTKNRRQVISYLLKK